jgi:glycosyltransferase involved in cell wall biosynthesis
VRVLVDAANLKPGQGGIRTYTIGLIRALAQEPRLSLVVATSVPEVADGGDFELVHLDPYTRSVAGRAAWRETHLGTLARRARADVVVAPVPELPFRRLPLPAVVVVHDVGPLVAPAFYTRNKRVRYSATVRQACNRAEAIVCVSNATLIGLRGAIGVDPARCVVIGEGPQLFEVRRDEQLAVADPYLLYVGSLDPRKNVDTLVRAFVDAEPALPARLVIVGPTERGEIAQLSRQSRRARYRVEHRGFVDVETLAALYRSCVGVVLPSLYEGFGLPVLEAFNAEAPVVASDIPSVREIGGEGALYVPRPLDSDCWREMLLELCTDASLRERLREAGRAVSDANTWDAVATRFADLVVATASGAEARVPRPTEPTARIGARAVGD